MIEGLSAEEETRLQTLNTELASDPARTVRQLQAKATRTNAPDLAKKLPDPHTLKAAFTAW